MKMKLFDLNLRSRVAQAVDLLVKKRGAEIHHKKHKKTKSTKKERDPICAFCLFVYFVVNLCLISLAVLD